SDRYEKFGTSSQIAASSSQETVGQVTHGQAFGGRPRLAASVQLLPLGEILDQRPVGILPRPKVVQLIADFLGPAAGPMRKQREVGGGFRSFRQSSRIGHGTPLDRKVEMS